MKLNVLFLLTFFILASAARADDAIVAVTVPELSPTAQAGQAAFGQYCAECHGATAGGTDQGPPLVHRLYVASHHADMAFVMAARQGVRAHHWDFGNMEPVPDVTDEELDALIVYVRELQKANGLP